MSHLQTKIVTHKSLVQSLFKRACRNSEAWHLRRVDIRFDQVMMRQKFEQNKNVDMRIAKKLLEDGEDELFKNLHPMRKQFPTSPGGVAHMREPKWLDWLADYWDPIEKAAYPKYFAKREMWKKERIDRWEKSYGKIKDPWADL